MRELRIIGMYSPFVYLLLLALWASKLSSIATSSSFFFDFGVSGFSCSCFCDWCDASFFSGFSSDLFSAMLFSSGCDGAFSGWAALVSCCSLSSLFSSSSYKAIQPSTPVGDGEFSVDYDFLTGTSSSKRASLSHSKAPNVWMKKRFDMRVSRSLWSLSWMRPR